MPAHEYQNGRLSISLHHNEALLKMDGVRMAHFLPSGLVPASGLEPMDTIARNRNPTGVLAYGVTPATLRYTLLDLASLTNATVIDPHYWDEKPVKPPVNRKLFEVLRVEFLNSPNKAEFRLAPKSLTRLDGHPRKIRRFDPAIFESTDARLVYRHSDIEGPDVVMGEEGFAVAMNPAYINVGNMLTLQHKPSTRYEQKFVMTYNDESVEFAVHFADTHHGRKWRTVTDILGRCSLHTETDVNDLQSCVLQAMVRVEERFLEKRLEAQEISEWYRVRGLFDAMGDEVHRLYSAPLDLLDVEVAKLQGGTLTVDDNGKGTLTLPCGFKGENMKPMKIRNILLHGVWPKLEKENDR